MMRRSILIRSLAGLAAALAFGALNAAAQSPPPAASPAQSVTPTPAAPLEPGPARFAAAIAAFEAADRATPPPACPVLFVGSSTIRFWKTLDADMAPLAALNRGFGGSEISDVDFYFARVVRAYRPRAIVFYAGDNDIHAGKSPERVYEDFTRFMVLKGRALGATPVFFISAKPSKARLSELAAQSALNEKVRALAAARRDLHYIDVVPAMLDAGKPKDIFVADGLHMTPDGYAIWTRIVAGALRDARVGEARCRR
jgi:lysophospholipase L1-like esterase